MKSGNENLSVTYRRVSTVVLCLVVVPVMLPHHFPFSLFLQVRSINRKLVEAEANEDGAAVRDDRLTSLETRLLDMGSELVS